MKEKSKNKWVYTEYKIQDVDEEPNRPDWSHKKELKDIVFEAVPPSPLKDWLDKDVKKKRNP